MIEAAIDWFTVLWLLTYLHPATMGTIYAAIAIIIVASTMLVRGRS